MYTAEKNNFKIVVTEAYTHYTIEKINQYWIPGTRGWIEMPDNIIGVYQQTDFCGTVGATKINVQLTRASKCLGKLLSFNADFSLLKY